jgi:hypothetical protein
LGTVELAGRDPRTAGGAVGVACALVPAVGGLFASAAAGFRLKFGIADPTAPYTWPSCLPMLSYF